MALRTQRSLPDELGKHPMNESTEPIEPAERKPTSTIYWKDRRGKQQSRAINHLIDIRDYQRCAVYPWLLMAANQHLSTTDIWSFMMLVAKDHPSIERPLSWLQKRRWMTQPPDSLSVFSYPNRDGQDERAKRIIAENPDLSLRNLVVLLRERGMDRGKDWVRKARGACLVAAP